MNVFVIMNGDIIFMLTCDMVTTDEFSVNFFNQKNDEYKLITTLFKSDLKKVWNYKNTIDDVKNIIYQAEVV